MTLLVNEREIVVPGEQVAKGMDFVPGTGLYRKGEFLIAQKLGLISLENKVVKITPLSGKYIPALNDRVIGRVIDVLMTGWRFDINCAYSAVLPLKDASREYIAKNADLTQFFDIGEYVICRITNVTSQKLVDISMMGPGLRKLDGGRIISVNPKKVPRIIGKEGSMISMIKDATKTDIIVGQNGLIWISGEPERELNAIKAIKFIVEEAHLQGLTDRVKELLK